MLLVIEFLLMAILGLVLYMLYTSDGMTSKKSRPNIRAVEYWDGRERRQHERFKKELIFSYAVEKKPHLVKNGKAVDVSHGGMKITSGEKFQNGSILNLKITLPGGNNTIELEAEVVWSQDSDEKDPDGKRLFSSGVRFLYIKEPAGANFAAYIRSLKDETCA